MKIEERILNEYSQLVRLNLVTSLPDHFRPTPTANDYQIGYIERCCIIKRNDDSVGREISPSLTASVDQRLYKIYSFKWKISGNKNRTVVNGIIEDFGVYETNQSTIERLNPKLSRFFNNYIEFWRGY